MRSIFVALALTACQPPTDPAPPSLPGGAHSLDLRAAYVRAVEDDAPAPYDFEPRERELLARNRAQGLAARVGPEGLRTWPEGAPATEGAWWLALRLSAVGRGASRDAIRTERADLDHRGNRATLDHTGRGVTEWYVNGPLGIDQGFVVDARPSGAASEPIALEVAVGGDLQPVADPGGASVSLSRADGTPVLHYSDLFARDASGRRLAAEMTIEDAAIVLHVDDEDATYPLTVDPLVWSETRKITASDGQAGDWFGASVAISSDVAVVGAYREDGFATPDCGAVYVFERDLGGADAWGERIKLLLDDGLIEDYFGYSVAVSGDTAVVGARTLNRVGVGAAYVYDRDLGGADNWGQRTQLAASDGALDDAFGWSVAISGDTVIVGTPYEDSAARNAGAVYVFERDLGGADTWGERAKLTAGDGAAGDNLGTSVALSGDTAILGAPYRGEGGFFRGAAYVFERNLGGADAWGQRAKLTASDPGIGDRLGSSVAVSSDTALLGAPYQPGGGAERGAAYVFDRDLGGADAWGERAKLVASAPEDHAFFAWSVALSGDAALVGAPFQDGDIDDEGVAYAFDRDEGGADAWGEREMLGASDAQPGDNFGYAVAFSGATALVGAVSEDAMGVTAGAAYVLELGLAPDGSDCTLPGDCVSGHCIDGVCCDTDCGGGSLVDCEACSVASGAPADGTCAPVDDGSECDDELFCTGTETCLAGVCGRSTGDPCAVQVGDADADCTESCDEVTDGCTANDPDDSACSDGAWCNGAERCSAGICGASSGNPCAGRAGDADTDCSESCNEAIDDCTANDPNGTTCDDGLFCTGANTCSGGVCRGAGDPCAPRIGDADDDCAESCDEAADDCVATDPNGSACSDGLWCDGTERCNAGACGGSTGDPCTASVGDLDADCSESCDEGADACTAADPNGTTCDDGAFCTGTETCAGGVCGGSTGDPCAANVGDGDTDCSESCDEARNACTLADPIGSACDDGLFCSGTDTCAGGACVGSGDPCAANVGDADDDCSESCDEASDTCTAPDPDVSACDDVPDAGVPDAGVPDAGVPDAGVPDAGVPDPEGEVDSREAGGCGCDVASTSRAPFAAFWLGIALVGIRRRPDR